MIELAAELRLQIARRLLRVRGQQIVPAKRGCKPVSRQTSRQSSRAECGLLAGWLHRRVHDAEPSADAASSGNIALQPVSLRTHLSVTSARPPAPSSMRTTPPPFVTFSAQNASTLVELPTCSQHNMVRNTPSLTNGRTSTRSSCDCQALGMSRPSARAQAVSWRATADRRPHCSSQPRSSRRRRLGSSSRTAPARKALESWFSTEV